MCSPPVGGLSTDGIHVARESIIQGTVTLDGAPAAAVYVRLLDGSGEFTAEVVTSATGQFRFFARPGEWTLRALSARGAGETKVVAAKGTAVDAPLQLQAHASEI
jgi:hypothetical protein